MVLPEPVSGGIFLNLLRTLPEPTLCQVELVRCFLKWKLPETFPDTEMIKKCLNLSVQLLSQDLVARTGS